MKKIVEISDLSSKGSGVAKFEDGKVFFVPFTMPGDLVLVEVVKDYKHYCFASKVELIRPSDKRQKPMCEVFEQCGGCQWQHVPYSIQWETKKKAVLEALRRFNIKVPKVQEFPAIKIWNYRNRVQLRGLKNKIGFFASSSQTLVAIQTCPIADPKINANIERLRTEGMHQNKTYKVEVEVLPSGQIKQTWNQKHAFDGFRQVHSQQNEQMIEYVSQIFESQEQQSRNLLMDLYGGNGNLSFPLRRQFKKIHCVDTVIKNPKRDKNFESRLMSVESYLKQSKKFYGTHVLLDPPRAGLTVEIVDLIARLDPVSIVHVGCDIDHWAKDMSRWVQKGFHIQAIAIVDMFPQTIHCETIAFLKASNN